MGTVNLSGSLLAGPTCTGGSFPSASLSEVLALLNNPKPYQAATGILNRRVASPNAFITLPAIGAGGDVTRGDTLYAKSDGPLLLELTQDDGSGSGTVVAVIPFQGVMLLEFPSTQLLLGLRVKGNANLVYFVSGPA